ncbi:MAG: hypothetical protein K6T65_15230 [Peptococcaceae bacterium]|nr:hypothetical protein [Peptococcaceae bacterium]
MFEGINVISDVVKSCGGKIVGRKKMHKIFFILQELGFLKNTFYNFRWNYYGVYSDELSNDIEIAEFFDILREREEKDGGYRVYVIESVQQDYCTSIVKSSKFKCAVNILSREESRVLEVLSSIIYFSKKGLNQEEVKEKLLIFKGHLEKFFPAAYNLYDKLHKIA